MKKIAHYCLVALVAIVLSWFLPWLCSLAFPTADNDPFVAFSPVSGSFIISENNGSGLIYEYDGDSDVRSDVKLTRDQRDLLLPHIYYNQLIGRGCMPDTIAGRPVTIQDLKQSQWVFNSMPRDINRVAPEVYLLMESMPERFDLEDPGRYFTVDDGHISVSDIETGKTDESMCRRFTEVFSQRGFKFPIKSSSANITTRKPYDEGYMLIDANGNLFHFKMQVRQPYLVRIDLPDGAVADRAFILENVDRSVVALVNDTDGNLYAIRRERYSPVKLPVGKVDFGKERLTVVKNMFNWVVRVKNSDATRWVAFDSDTYAPSGVYAIEPDKSDERRFERYIFPFVVTFTSIDDCYVCPRVGNISLSAIILNLVVSLFVAFVMRRRGKSLRETAGCLPVTLIAGLYTAIPLLIIKD